MKRNTIYRMGTALLLSAVLAAQSFGAAFAEEALTVPEEELQSELPQREREIVRIRTAEDLTALAESCILDSSSENMEVLLEEDIDLTGIGFSGIPIFCGVFDGQGHAIRGFSVTDGGTHTGFFRYLTDTAVVCDLDLTGRILCREEGDTIGGIAGQNEGLISNCSFDGRITSLERTGGIVGVNAQSGVVTNAVFYGTVLCPRSTGGIAGMNHGKILSSVNAGKVNTELFDVPDNVSLDLSANLTDTLSNFDISSLSSEEFVDIINVGGIAGQSDGLIDNCVNSGTVGYAHTGYNVGGIAGDTKGTISYCRNDGEVYGRKDTGGIAGQIEPETVWDYSSEQLDTLLEELKNLDALLSGMISDAAGGIGAAHDQLTLAEGAASQTISDLEQLLGSTGDELSAAAEQIKELMTLLEQAISEEDAAAVGTCLQQLCTLLQTTDLSAQPVVIGFSGTLGTDATADMAASSDSIHSTVLSLQQAIRSSAASAGTRENANAGTAGYLPDTSEEQADAPLPAISPIGDDGLVTEDVGTDSGLPGGVVEDNGSAGDVLAAEDGGIPDDGWIEDDSFIIVEDGDAQAGYGGSVAEEDNDTALLEEEAAAEEDLTVISQETRTADAGPEETLIGEVTVTADDDPGAADGPAADDPAWSIDGPTLENDLSRTANGSADLSLAGTANASVDGKLQVSLESEIPNAGELTGLIEQLLAHSSDLLDVESLKLAKDVLDKLQFTQPDAEPFYHSFDQLMTALKPLDDDVAATAAALADDFSAVTAQMDAIYETFFSYIDQFTLLDDDVEEDISLPDPWQSDEGVISMCLNCASVSADTNVGGIVGTIDYEDLIDAEDKVDLSGYLLKDARKLIFAAVRESENRGAVLAKKASAGGIGGNISYGIVTRCISAGGITVGEGEGCGGIAGTADGAITECEARNQLNGQTYTGGIVGRGSTILSCVSYSQVDAAGSYLGAVAGWSEGNVQDNQYLDRGLGGVDGVSRSGAADPFTEESAQSKEVTAVLASASETSAKEQADELSNELADELGSVIPDIGADTPAVPAEITSPEGGIPSASVIDPVVTFLIDDEVYEQYIVPFGQPLTELPTVKNDGDDYWVWDDFDRDAIYSDITVTGAYHHPVRTLAAFGNPPQFLAEGIFYEGQTLQVEEIESVREEAGTEPDTGTEIEEVRPGHTYTLRVNDYTQPLKIRMKAGSGGTVYKIEESGEETELSYETDGSYLVFDLENGGTVRYEEAENPIDRFPLSIKAGIACGCAALLLLLLLVYHHKKKKKNC